jgi:DHA1 family multidrug resistance protein-like MFS transporter
MTRAASLAPEDSRAVRRVVIALSASAFTEWCGATAVIPLLPLYLRHRGASVTLVGITMASFFAAALLVQYPLGRLSDRIGRRKVQVGGLATYAVASVLFALAGAPLLALVFRALQGCGAGIVDVANAATIAEVVPASHRGRAFGTFYGSRNVAMAIGPFIGGLAGIEGMKWVFLLAAVASAAAIIPILTYLPSRRTVRAAVDVATRRLRLWRNRSFLGVAVAFLTVGVVIGVYEVCWSLLLTVRGATPWEVGISWTLFAVPFAVMSFPAGWLVDHFDRRYLVAMAMAGSGAFALTYPFLHSVALLIGLGSAEAILVALGAPAESAQLAQSVPASELGRAQGAAASVQTAATAVAAGVAGTLFAVHIWLPFVGASAIILLAVALIGLLWREVPGRVQPITPQAVRSTSVADTDRSPAVGTAASAGAPTARLRAAAAARSRSRSSGGGGKYSSSSVK